MTPSARRIGTLALVFGLGVLLLVGALAWTMLVRHEDWLVRSYRNRWTFRDTPVRRGRILDRHGRELVADEVRFELRGHYRTFRRGHPVGTVVHGANRLRAAVGLGGEADGFGYTGGEGALAAFDFLGRLPVRVLFAEEELEEEARIDMRFYAAAAGSVLTGGSRRGAHTRLRQAWESTPSRPLWAAFGEAGELRAELARVWEELEALDRALPPTSSGSLLAHLEALRRQEIEERGWARLPLAERPRVGGGERARPQRPGEERFVMLAPEVPFDTAAALRLRRAWHAGLRLRTVVERTGPGLEAGSLQVVVGRVGGLDWAEPEVVEEVEERTAEAVGAEELGELVPSGTFVTPRFEEELRRRARSRVRAHLTHRGRRGLGGVEAGMDDALSGAPGMRLVARDRRARERFLRSRLDLDPGRDVRLTIDLELQEVAEELVRDMHRQHHGVLVARNRSPGRLDTCMVVLEGETGDVLAVAAHPLRVVDPVQQTEWLRPMPGVVWRSNGTIGSLAKPFLYVQAMAAPEGVVGDAREYAVCGADGSSGLGRYLGCARHGRISQDGYRAVVHSCNVYFYELARALDRPGVQHALERFGLAPHGGAGFELAGGGRVLMPGERPPVKWPRLPSGSGAERVAGMASRLRLAFQQDRRREKLAIGYGVQASPLLVARAYAGLATGRLPGLGMVRGAEREAAVPLDVPERHLREVRRALREVPGRGTARRVRGLQRFGVYGKTGTAEIGSEGENNAWFAGWVETAEEPSRALVFVAVAYWVPDGEHGADVAGRECARLLERIRSDPVLSERYPVPGGGR